MVDFKKIIADEIYDEALGLSVEDIMALIEIPNDEKMGDYAFPCFKLAKTLRKAPPLIAKGIAEGISGNTMFEKVSTNMDFLSREKEVLAFWKKNEIFKKSLEIQILRNRNS